MMRLGLVAAALLLPTMAHAERFAVHCSGTATAVRFENGQTRPMMPPTRTSQIYVINEEAQSVHRALMPRQEFEDLCGREGRCFRSFAPGLIQIVHEIDGEPAFRSSLTLYRQDGRANYELEDWSGGQRTLLRWEMRCRRGEIPVFDPRRNRI